MSFHGIPKQCAELGDPYPDQCRATARLLAARLALKQNEWIQTYQSRFGPKEWLRPYTDETLQRLARAGVNSIDLVCPGFSADCLETLEENAMTNKELFLQAGGARFNYIPCLNDDPEHIEALTALIIRNLSGWVQSGQ
jgi:ferrochelatase